MGLFSKFKNPFKRKRRTHQANHRSYQTRPQSNRKPLKLKKRVQQTKPLRINRRDERRQKRLKVLLVSVISLAFIVGLIYLIAGTRFFEIQNIEIHGDAETLEEQAFVQNTLEEQLGKNILGFSTSKVGKELLEKYPYLKNIRVKRKFFHTLKAELITYEKVANVQMQFENGDKKFYVVNELGYIASIGLQNEGLPVIVMDVTGTEIDLPTEEQEENQSYQVNEALIQPEALQELLGLRKDFEGRFNMQVLEVDYLKRAREIHLLTERYFYVWFDQTQDLDVQMAKLKKALTQVNIYEADLSYIDLRISGQNGEKVIYK